MREIPQANDLVDDVLNPERGLLEEEQAWTGWERRAGGAREWICSGM